MAKKSGGLKAFRRACRFLWPQRRRLVLAVMCSLALALSFAASLSAVVPVVRLFIAEQGPRAMLFLIAASQARGVDLEAWAPSREDPASLGTSAGWIVQRVAADSAAGSAGIRIGDVLLPADDGTASQDFLEDLSRRGVPVTLRAYAPLSQRPEDIRTVELPVLDVPLASRMLLNVLRGAGNWLPKDVSTQARQRTLLMVFSFIFVLVVFSAVCRFVAEYMVVIASNRAVMDLRRHMYTTVMYLPMGWFGQHLSETMSRVVTDFRDIERGYRALFGKLTTEPIRATVMLTCAVLVDWRITTFALIAGVLGGLIVWVIGRKIRKANRRLLAGYAQLLGVLNATLLGMRVVRAHNNQTFERRRMWQADRRLLKQLLKMGRWGALTGPALEVMGVTVIMFGVLWMADHVFSEGMRPEKFMLLIGFLVAIFDSIRKMSAVFPRLARADGAAQRVFEMMDRPVERRSHQAPRLPALDKSVEFRDVTFTYPDTTRPALSHVSLVVHKGQRVALVGPNGSGKTTLMSLLCRFFDAQSGHILFDGRDIADYSADSLREQVSLVTQDAIIFAARVTENIAYGMRDPSPQAVEEAARRAHAHEFITELKKGYDTILGEFGTTLSGGQRQRLALARAIFRNAPIFIFDEATSQIDVDSEKKILEATRQFMEGRTSFVIAHRIATITAADQIVVFDQGAVLDVGQHSELLQRCELYSTLYRTHVAP